jgi:hypothetical protein
VPALVYRNLRQALPSQDDAAALEPAAAVLGGDGFAGLAEFESAPSSTARVISAPASVIQAQYGGAASYSAADDPSLVESASPAAADETGGGDSPDVANLALDKLAREVYERLRHRLIVERERAGLSPAFS